MLPYLLDVLKSRVSSVGELAAEECPSIIVVVSPLISLMKDQVAKCSERGLPCTFIRDTNIFPSCKIENHLPLVISDQKIEMELP